MRPALTLRRATLDDAVRIRRVHQASVRSLCSADYSAAQIEAWIGQLLPSDYRHTMREEWQLTWVAQVGTRMAGFSVLDGDLVRAVYVHPRYARRGVGSALLAAAEAEARARGVQVLRLNASLTAVPFYLRHGYCEVGPGAHPTDAGVTLPVMGMRKVLHDP